MSELWIVGALLIILALGSLIVPYVWGGRESNLTRGHANRQIYRDRLQELERDLADGRCTESTFRHMRAELARTLIDDADVPASATRAQASVIGLAALAVGLVATGVGVGYFYLHGLRGPVTDWMETRERHAEPVVQFLEQPDELPPVAMEDPDGFVRALQMRLVRDDSQNPADWFLLGSLNLRLERPLLAVPALERSLRLSPQHLQTKVTLAQALVQQSGGRLDDRSRDLLDDVLGIVPDHQGALLTLGFGAFNGNDYGTAISAWERVIALRPDDEENNALLARSIDAARERMEESPPGVEQPFISVTVDVAPELRQEIVEGSTLFIFAKAFDGPPMPLAVVREPLAELPKTFRLDDSRSMSPTLKLSSAEAVTVGARISRLGTANVNAGDLEGVSGRIPIDGNGVTVSLTIDRMVP